MLMLGYWDEKTYLYKLNIETKKSIKNKLSILGTRINRMSRTSSSMNTKKIKMSDATIQASSFNIGENYLFIVLPS